MKHARRTVKGETNKQRRTAVAVGVAAVLSVPLCLPVLSTSLPANAATSPTASTSPMSSAEMLASFPEALLAQPATLNAIHSGASPMLLPTQRIYPTLLPVGVPERIPGRLVDWPPLAEGTYPPLPQNSGEGRRIVYSKTVMQVWLVEADGAVVKWHEVSGKKSMPRPGTYKVYSKSRHAMGGQPGSGIRMEYMTRFAHGVEQPIGFHSIPHARNGKPLQSESQLGQALSSGCVRQADADAALLWEFAPMGTTVIVIG